MKNLDTTKREHIKNINKKIVSYVDELKRQRSINKIHRKRLQQEIYRYSKKETR